MGVPSQGCEWGGAHTASVPPLRQWGWGLGRVAPAVGWRWEMLGPSAARAGATSPSPSCPPPIPHVLVLGCRLPWQPPPQWAALPWRWLPSLGARYCSSRPPPRWGQDGAAGGVPHHVRPWDGAGGSRLQQAQAAHRPPSPVPGAAPLGGLCGAPQPVGDGLGVGGARGQGWAQRGGRVWGQLCLWGRFGWGLWCRGGGVLTDPWGLGSGSPCGCWRPAPWGPRCWAGGWVPQGDGLSPPGGQAASPPPVSPLPPCLAPSHVSPASLRWR